MEVIIRSQGSLVEEIVFECPGLTWNQVFCELDRMSRAGQVRLTIKRPGFYSVTSAAVGRGPLTEQPNIGSDEHITPMLSLGKRCSYEMD
jgi:hypothetical protein